MRMGKRHMVALEFLVHRRLGSRSDMPSRKNEAMNNATIRAAEYTADPQKKAGASGSAGSPPAFPAVVETLFSECPDEGGGHCETDTVQQMRDEVRLRHKRDPRRHRRVR